MAVSVAAVAVAVVQAVAVALQFASVGLQPAVAASPDVWLVVGVAESAAVVLFAAVAALPPAAVAAAAKFAAEPPDLPLPVAAVAVPDSAGWSLLTF